MRKGIRFTQFVAAAALACTVITSQAFASSNINNFLVTGENTVSDQDREYLIDRIFTVKGQIDVGDSLRGLINFNTVNNSGANLGGSTGNEEFTGVYQVKVASVAPMGANNVIVTFGPDPDFATYLGTKGIATTGGEIAALFTSPIINSCSDFSDTGCGALGGGHDDGTPGSGHSIPPSSADVSTGSNATEEAFIATNADGAFWATIGFTGNPAESIAGFGPKNITSAFLVGSGQTAGLVNAGLGLISTGPGFNPAVKINRTEINIDTLGLVDFAFTQNLKGVRTLDTAFEISTNTDVNFNATIATVPEPSTVLLFGGGLLGLGVLMRRRSKKA